VKVRGENYPFHFQTGMAGVAERANNAPELTDTSMSDEVRGGGIGTTEYLANGT
jgi:hypothetical protein